MENEILSQILLELKNLNVRQINMEQRQNSIGEELVAFQEFTMQKFERLENEQKRTNLIIENEIRPSIQALAEGNFQMQSQLDRIEDKVTSHDEVIFRRVK